MFITDAYAQATAGGLEGAGASIMQFLPIILVVFIMYMLMWRPQQKKMKAHKAMIAAVKRGDKVVAAGGIIGTVSKVVERRRGADRGCRGRADARPAQQHQ